MAGAWDKKPRRGRGDSRAFKQMQLAICRSAVAKCNAFSAAPRANGANVSPTLQYICEPLDQIEFQAVTRSPGLGASISRASRSARLTSATALPSVSMAEGASRLKSRLMRPGCPIPNNASVEPPLPSQALRFSRNCRSNSSRRILCWCIHEWRQYALLLPLKQQASNVR